MTVAWVIGARGLLGSAVSEVISARESWHLLPADGLPWGDAAALERAATSTMSRLLDAAEARSSAWTIIWAAGAGVTSAPQAQLDAELAELRTVLDAVSTRLGGGPYDGSIFYSSSAGGVYGGSVNPPYTENSAPVPISPYGQFKLDAEAAVREFAEHAGISSLCGRIANLFGPGQRLDKMQGLISQIARAQFSPAPVSIYVSLDTVRDYIYAADCASLVVDALDELRRRSALAGAPTAAVKILASGNAVTIGELLGHFRALAKARPHIMLGQSAAASMQAHDLRLRSVVWPELDRRTLTPLPVGIDQTMGSVLRGLVER